MTWCWLGFHKWGKWGEGYSVQMALIRDHCEPITYQVWRQDRTCQHCEKLQTQVTK